MTRRIPLVVALVMGAMAILVPASIAKTPSHNSLYVRCWNHLGAECGRNISDDGFRHADGRVTKATHAQLHAWHGRIHTALNPPPAPAPVAPTTTTSYVAPAPTSSGGCPASMAAEATSPTAVNPTSGASGCYQVLPSTAAAMGPACSDVNSQSCVAAICASQGNSAWAASGSTPCG